MKRIKQICCNCGTQTNGSYYNGVLQQWTVTDTTKEQTIYVSRCMWCKEEQGESKEEIIIENHQRL